ncbi:MAG: NAD(P)-binding domain-containing protein [Anaerolineae bacterium]|nr:NAD(P)-binding domain-containing protein [Anaerolineae bacterium]
MTSEQQGPRFFGQGDVDAGTLAGERVAVLGYGNLGHAMAANLRDSGIQDLLIGNIADVYAEAARADRFEVVSISEAAATGDVVLVLLPDEVIPEVFMADVAPHLRAGSAILFASGYTLAYGLISPSRDVDVLLLAPRMGGEYIRGRFLDGTGFVGYVSVEQDATGRAWRRLLGVAGAVGALCGGVMELSARQEADLDLLVEHTMGAVIGVTVMSTFTLGVEAGIPPEALVMEMYMSGEMESVFRAFRERGFFRAADFHGPTAMYGGFVRTFELMTSDLPARFKAMLESIQSGEFAAQFQAERQAGYPNLSQAQFMSGEQGPIARPIVDAEARVRRMLGLNRDER